VREPASSRFRLVIGGLAGLIGLGGLGLWMYGRGVDPAASGPGGSGAGVPSFVAGEPEPAPPPTPAVPDATRVTNVMALWRQSIVVRDPEGVLACDRGFLDEPPVFMAALVESARKDSEERVRAFSTRVLGKFTNPELAPTFLELLKDSSPFVRGNAAWALGQLSPELGREALLRVKAHDRVESVRQSATEALARLQAPQDQHEPGVR
jgi:hypothetical protein